MTSHPGGGHGHDDQRPGGHHHGGVAVVVGPGPDVSEALAVVTVQDVDDRERHLRASPAASRLPQSGSSEGRQLRRWIAHSLAAERLVELEITASPALAAAGRPAFAVTDVSGALGAGSLALAVLTHSMAARRLAASLTDDVQVAPQVVDRLAAGHPTSLTRSVRHVVSDVAVNGGRPVAARVEDLPHTLGGQLPTAQRGAVLTAADAGGRLHEITVLDDPPATGSGTPKLGSIVRADAWSPGSAVAAARARAFGRWLDGRRHALVHPHPGFEHPGDPTQPDNTHRH